MFGYRIHVEEADLVAAFRQDYVAYQRATRRIIPLIYWAANGSFRICQLIA